MQKSGRCGPQSSPAKSKFRTSSSKVSTHHSTVSALVKIIDRRPSDTREEMMRFQEHSAAQDEVRDDKPEVSTHHSGTTALVDLSNRERQSLEQEAEVGVVVEPSVRNDRDYSNLEEDMVTGQEALLQVNSSKSSLSVLSSSRSRDESCSKSSVIGNDCLPNYNAHEQVDRDQVVHQHMDEAVHGWKLNNKQDGNLCLPEDTAQEHVVRDQVVHQLMVGAVQGWEMKIEQASLTISQGDQVQIRKIISAAPKDNFWMDMKISESSKEIEYLVSRDGSINTSHMSESSNNLMQWLVRNREDSRVHKRWVQPGHGHVLHFHQQTVEKHQGQDAEHECVGLPVSFTLPLSLSIGRQGGDLQLQCEQDRDPHHLLQLQGDVKALQDAGATPPILCSSTSG